MAARGLWQGWLVRGQLQSGSTLCRLRAADLAARRCSSHVLSAIEENALWEKWIRNEELRPAARAMVRKIKPEFHFGVDPSQRGVRAAAGSLLEFFIQTREKHPGKVVLVRVGEFYETIGYDAVVLVQHAGLNPMGTGVPRAGMPIPNLRRTLADLTSAGFSVVVAEETPAAYGRRTRKERFVAGVVTPASPYYTHGLTLSDDNATDPAAASPTVLALCGSSRGISVLELDLDTRMCRTHQGLTEDAAAARVLTGNYAPPLYIHGLPSAGPVHHAVAAASHVIRCPGAAMLAAGATVASTTDRFNSWLLQRVCKDTGMPPDTQFSITGTAADAPQPLYLSTAKQLGIVTTDGMPSLIDSLMTGVSAPRNSQCRSFLRRLLLSPPPPGIALHIAAACTQLLEGHTGPLPEYRALSAGRFARLILEAEASATMYADLHGILETTEQSLAEEPLNSFSTSVLRVCSHHAGVSVPRAVLAKDAQALIDDIANTVDLDTFALSAKSSAVQGGSGGLLAGFTEQEAATVQQFLKANEGFRGKIRRQCAEEEYLAVEVAAERVQAALLEDLKPHLEQLQQQATSGKKKAAQSILMYDFRGNTLCARGKPQGGSVAPRDKHGRQMADRFSTDSVEQALATYKTACDAALSAVQRELKKLSERSATRVNSVVLSTMFCTVAKTLSLHVAEARRNAWCLPTLEASGSLQIEEMSPFWMDRRAGSAAVVNSLSIGGMAVLTGPNTSGKSTVMRSICAVALLANCGLLVPASRATVPTLGAFYFRAASHDAPAEGLSTFAIEMLDVAAILCGEQHRRLVMLDELGRGTEARAGGALGAAVLESLRADGRSIGMFATHMYHMLSLPIELPESSLYQMEVVESGSNWQSTCRIVPGQCNNSRAIDIADHYGVPPAVTARARELLELTPVLSISQEDTSATSVADVPSEVANAASLFEDLACSVLGSDTDVPTVAGNRVPGPSTVGASCVYLLTTVDGWHYVGESDNLPSRARAHRSMPEKRGCTIAYVVVPAGKSAARSLETSLIQAMASKQIPMLSLQDGSSAHFSR